MEEESAKNSVQMRPKKRAKTSKYRKALGPPQWNDRFQLEKMPQYNAYKDQYAAAFVAMIKRSDVRYASAKKVQHHRNEPSDAFRRPRTSQIRHVPKSSKVSEPATEKSMKSFGSPKSPLKNVAVTRAPTSGQPQSINVGPFFSPGKARKVATAGRTSFIKSSFPETTHASPHVKPKGHSSNKRSLTPSSSIFPTRQGRKLKMSEGQVESLREELEQNWKKCKTPIYHQQIFIRSLHGLSAELYIPLIVREIKDLNKERAPIQSVIKGIVAREECLQYILEMEKVLAQKRQDSQLTKQLLEECVELLHSLRILSLNAVECIVRWRERLLQTFALSEMDSPFKVMGTIPFIWGEVNYLTKIKTDSAFLEKSAYSNFFNFSVKSDPFLLIPSTVQPTRKKTPQRKQKESQLSKWIVPLHPSLLKRVRACETVIIEETMSEELAFQTLGGLEGIKNNLEPPPFSGASRHSEKRIPTNKLLVQQEEPSFGAEKEQSSKKMLIDQVLEDTPNFKLEGNRVLSPGDPLAKFQPPPKPMQAPSEQEQVKRPPTPPIQFIKQESSRNQVAISMTRTESEAVSISNMENPSQNRDTTRDFNEDYTEDTFQEIKEDLTNQSKTQKEQTEGESSYQQLEESKSMGRNPEQEVPTERRVQPSDRSLDPRITDHFESHMTPRKNDSTATPNYQSFHRNATETMSESLAPIQMGSRSSRKNRTKFDFAGSAEDIHNPSQEDSKLSLPPQMSTRGLNKIFEEVQEEERAQKKPDYSEKIIKECLNAPDLLIWRQRPNEQDVEDLIMKYIENVQAPLVNSFVKVTSLLDVANKGREPGWLFFTDTKGDSLLGLLVFNVDATHANRVMIHHFTAIGKEFMSAMLAKALHYIWENLDCSEIRLPLRYYTEQGQETTNKDLQDLLMKQFGFKWKTMMHDTMSGKKMVLGVSRPRQITFKNFRKLGAGGFDFKFKSSAIVKIANKAQITSEKELSQPALNLLSVLPILQTVEAQNIEDEKISEVFEKIEKSETALLSEQNMQLQENVKNLQNLEKIQNYSQIKDLAANLNMQQDSELKVANIATNIFWKSVNYSDLQVDGQKYFYTRIGDVKRAVLENERNLLIAQTNQPNYSIFIIDKIDESLKDKLNIDFWSNLHSLLHQADESTQDLIDLWLPAFSIAGENTLFSKKIEGIQVGEDKVISEVRDSFEINMQARQPLSCALLIEPDKSHSVVVQDSFLIGVLHEQVDELLGEPVLAVCVDKSDWMQLKA